MYDFDDIGIDVVEKGAHAEEVSTSPSQQHQYQYHQSHTSNLNISSSNATTSSTGHFLIQRHLMRAWSLMQKLIFS
jgi:hypothetical protein